MSLKIVVLFLKPGKLDHEAVTASEEARNVRSHSCSQREEGNKGIAGENKLKLEEQVWP